ncbi:hypothetical protein VP1G_07776 [Cytospora mali]|uniref:Transcription factor TFIIIC triple barrel domain-containing protein n=1 Tax=Cytospora mali TaxID=578113 RepID=A0A194V9M8_CYTMA|nr:hypothetical protein VP1G_07776 [Valsa mali var. pyri (nom. inval.)]
MVRTAKQPIGWPGTYPESAASFPLAKLSKRVDDEDEWEYEYSTTETETYYVTMDLSHPGMFEKVKDGFHSQNRGGYRQWFNPVYADPNKNTRFRPTKTNAILFADEDDKDDDEDVVVAPREDDENEDANQEDIVQVNANEDEPIGEDAGGDMDPNNPIDPRLRDMTQPSRQGTPHHPIADSQQGGVQQASKSARLRNVGEIQVLDLHSDNPIISYKGRIFSGSWASNIGTELIFGAHDEVANRGLPYLKDLPGDVDLMAASSVRILTTPADLKPKKPTVKTKVQRRPVNDHYRKLRKESGVVIPVAFDKHGFRKPQARFLENLMAIKRKRGEMDEATTMTKDTTRMYVDAEDDPEEAQLQKKRARDRRRQMRLLEEKAALPKGSRRRGNRWANKDHVVSFGGREPEDEGDEEEEGAGDGDGDGDGGGLSMRTPSKWEGMDGAEDEEGDGTVAEDSAMED